MAGHIRKKNHFGSRRLFISPDQQQIEFNAYSLLLHSMIPVVFYPETAWFWLSCQFRDANDRRIGLNLASGVNESFGNENAFVGRWSFISTH